MGTVRREGDWRLEKRREGVYEITFQKEPQLKVLTSDQSGGRRQESMFETIPVREVPSFSEAEGLFEEKAHGPNPLGMKQSVMGESGGQGLDMPDEMGEGIDLSETPPGVFGVATLFIGAVILYTFWGDGNRIALIMGVGFLAVGVSIIGYGAFLFKSRGWQKGWNFLVTPSADTGSSNTSDSSNPEKTPPAPQSLKDELYFERADRQCEYCGDDIDHFEVHHITPRSEGGENKPENLIVLCPNCHEKADRGSISKSRLRYQLND